MRSFVLFVTLISGSLTLTACGVQGRVAYDAGASQPKPPVVAPATKTEDTKTVTAAVVKDEAAPKAPTQDPRVHLALEEYRASAEAVLTIIWSKPTPTAAEAASFVGAIDRVLKANGTLQKRKDVGDADHHMLVEGAEVIGGVRKNLIARWTELSKTN